VPLLPCWDLEALGLPSKVCVFFVFASFCCLLAEKISNTNAPYSTVLDVFINFAVL